MTANGIIQHRLEFLHLLLVHRLIITGGDFLVDIVEMCGQCQSCRCSGELDPHGHGHGQSDFLQQVHKVHEAD